MQPTSRAPSGKPSPAALGIVEGDGNRTERRFPLLRSLGGCLALVVAATWMSPQPSENRVEVEWLKQKFKQDFFQYWATSQLLGRRLSPYRRQSYAQAFDLDVPARRITNNPPWSGLLMRPFVSRSFIAGAHLWLASGITFALTTPWIVWKTVAPTSLAPPLVLGLALINLPVLITLVYGQQSLLLCLFAAAAYAALVDRRFFLAGLLMVPLSMKPHLFFPLGLAAGVSLVCDRQWRLAAGFAGFFGPLLAVTLLLCPSSLADWFGDLTSSDSGVLVPSTASMVSVARLAWFKLTGADPGLTLAWVPAAATGVAVGWLRFRRRRPFDWREDYPVLLLAGLLATPYLWTYDMSLILVPQTVILARNWGHPPRRRLLLCILVVVNGFSLCFHPSPPGPLHVWIPFFWSALWILFCGSAPSAALTANSTPRGAMPATL